MNKSRRTLRGYLLLATLGFRSSPSYMLGSIALQVVSAIAFAAYPYGYRLFIDGIGKRDSTELLVGALVAGVLYVVSTIIGPVAFNSGITIQQKTNMYLVGRIAELINAMSGIEHFERPDQLQEIDLINQNRNVLASACQQILNLLCQSIRVGLAMALLVSVNPIFLLVPVLGLVPFFGDSYSSRFRQRIDKGNVEDIRLANQLFELAATAAPAKELRIFGLGDELRERHVALAKRVSDQVARASKVAFWMGTLGWGVFAAGFVGAIALVVVQAAHGNATPGQVLMVVVLINNLQSRVGSLVGNAGQLLQARKTAERFLWLEDHVGETKANDVDALVPSTIEQGITFDHVSFSYPGTEALVLQDVSLFIPRGTSVAIVGENGAGKTTLVKLLARMYEPSTGLIQVDRQDIGTFDVESWRSKMTAIFQDFGRYELPAVETVGVGSLDHIDDREAVLRSLEKTGGLDVIDSLDDGLETLLGRSFADGRELSGGQWQKLALGRGRMRDDALLLILDEPTSSLDATSEHAVFEQYVAAARDGANSVGAITILISHRFSTARMADLIVVLDGGRIAEVGSHSELLGLNGIYAELFRMQQRSYL